MADNSEEFDKKDSPEFSDEAIRRFLFGRLSAAEQLKFEERLFTDERCGLAVVVKQSNWPTTMLSAA